MAQKFHHDIEMCLFLYVHNSFCCSTEQRLYFALLIIIDNNNYESCFWLSSEFGKDPTIWQNISPTSSNSLFKFFFFVLFCCCGSSWGLQRPPHSFPRYCMTVASYEMRTSGNLIPTFAEFPGDWSESPTPCLFIYPSICLSLPSSVAAAAAC